MTLDPAAAQRIYKVLVYLAGVDSIDPGEAAVLSRFASEQRLPTDWVAGLAREGCGEAALEPAQGEAEQEAMIQAMIEIVAADDTLDHTEQERLLTLAERLRLPADAMRARLLERLMGG